MRVHQTGQTALRDDRRVAHKGAAKAAVAADVEFGGGVLAEERDVGGIEPVGERERAAGPALGSLG